MPTRSGKSYLISHKCNGANCRDMEQHLKYYSHENFNYKCSSCWEYCEKNGIMTSKEFGDKCREWARENTVDKDFGTFILKNKHISDKHLFNFLTSIFINMNKYISAEIGLELFKANPSSNRGHIVGSFIADWWEIKSKNTSPEKKWPGYMECYYGFWSNPIEHWSGINTASIPPKKPLGPRNNFINNEIIMNIKYNN